ncbi:helix-turn-helix domain-containing protein [Variovorax sp. J2P1-59]|uniref:TetR/AcrR family transcriptional regulator n=1 Tax=Variovorax flavidus TaxID=3053501 RepID=UPI002574DA28|nr:TetR/AcrR family transcriptional regulator [Variovorax sp. J2P1-59]MDM0074812.1 helix-turn-helix domain-containing protein [Variovorax sp. J2P1-59]
MRVPKERAVENRVSLLQAASRLFRERGIDGVGVAEVARAAGLTHGALYAHFPSKEALAAEAFSHGFNANLAAAQGAKRERQPTFEEHLDDLLSLDARDGIAVGCPMTASASEVARQGEAVSANFADAFEQVVKILEVSLGDALTPVKRRRLAVSTVAAKIGAIAVSRAVAKSNCALADEVLTATKRTMLKVRKAETTTRRD